MSNDLSARLIAEKLNATASSLEVEYHEQIDSTHRRARCLVENGLWSPTRRALVVADYQTAGRGRRARQWVSPPGDSLLFTVVESERSWKKAGSLLALAVALAVAESLERLYDLPARIKWPNDVHVRGRKISGVLIEQVAARGAGTLAISLGVNVNQSVSDWPEELRGGATSVARECGHWIDRLELLTTIFQALDTIRRSFASDHGGAILRSIQRRLSHVGQFVRIEEEGLSSIEGVHLGVDPDGALILRRPNGANIRCLTGSLIAMGPIDSESSH